MVLALTSRHSVSVAPPTRTRPEPPRMRRTSPLVRAAASLTRSLASRISPIMVMSNAPRLRALAARSRRPLLPGRRSCAVLRMAR